MLGNGAIKIMTDNSKSYFYHLQNIFVATDFLSYSTQALHLANELSEISCAALTCFHALEKLPSMVRDILFPYVGLGCDEVEILNELRSGVENHGAKFLRDTMGEDAEHMRLKVDFSRDSMAKSILHAASEVNADIMYAGSYGTKPHTTGIIGSMAATFVAYARIPLYLVKDPTHHNGHKKILVAFLDPTLSPQLLAWAVSFAMNYEGCDIEIVTPVSDWKACDRYGDYSGVNVNERNVAQAIENVTVRAKQAVQSIAVPFAFEAHARNLSFTHHAPVSNRASAVLKVADQIGADLIVIPSVQPSLNVDNEIREVARNITEYANQNCLVIPEAFLK